MTQSNSPVPAPKAELVAHAFCWVFGGFLGLTLLKFGNPPIMERWVTAPGNLMEFVIWSPWPIIWAYALFCLVALLGFFAARRRIKAPAWILFMPLVWLAWQALASSQSIDPSLSYPTLVHFAVCCACFYLGCFSVGTTAGWNRLWLGLMLGLLVVLAVGFEQRFGGLEQTRQYFETNIRPTLKEVPPDLLKKMSSNRIFATLFYPNALAGVILLLTPAVLCLLAGAREWFTVGARSFLVSAVGLAAIACLVWSGSKGGWLLLLFLGFLALMRLSFDRRVKAAFIGVVLIAGLAGFAWKYGGFFRKGATSVVARFDYWRAALNIAGAHPVLGTGPGTFAQPYERIKQPEAEMARLVHNDYLEQASDSGWIGFLSYTAFVAGALIYSYPRQFPHGQPGGRDAQRGNCPGADPAQRRQAPQVPRRGDRDKPALHPGKAALRLFTRPREDWLRFAVWLGVLGWALQSLFEFGLYLPALAWPAFALLGSLVRRSSKQTEGPAHQRAGIQVFGTSLGR